MGKVLIINDADFSANALDKVPLPTIETLVVEGYQSIGYYINKTNGELVAGAESSIVYTYTNINPSYFYRADGRVGGNVNTCLVAYYNGNTFLGYEYGSQGLAQVYKKQKINVPSNCDTIKLFGARNIEGAYPDMLPALYEKEEE